MSLATRCTACGTIFRVVEDQLRVSEGWVRCGRCAEVFDAREQLFDIEREAPPPWPPAFSASASPALADDEPDLPAPAPPQDETTWALPREEPVHTEAQRRDVELPDVEIDVDLPAPAPVEATASGFHDSRREPYFGEPSLPEEPVTGPSPPSPLPKRLPPVEPAAASSSNAGEPAGIAHAAPAAVETELGAGPATVPQASFLRDAEQASRWRSPRVRAALSALAAVLALLLSLQATWQFRDALVALFPATEPAMQGFCAATGCELQAWRRIDALTVDSSSLSVAGNGNHYKLKVSLRNKAGYVVALPWVDLTLTDGNGAVVSRRMLKPGDFDTPSDRIAAHGELALQLVFSTGTQRVSGYTIEIFHP